MIQTRAKPDVSPVLQLSSEVLQAFVNLPLCYALIETHDMR